MGTYTGDCCILKSSLQKYYCMIPKNISPLTSLTSKFLHRYFYLVSRSPAPMLQNLHHQQILTHGDQRECCYS